MNCWVIHMAKLRHDFEMVEKVIKDGIIGVGRSEIEDLKKGRKDIFCEVELNESQIQKLKEVKEEK